MATDRFDQAMGSQPLRVSDAAADAISQLLGEGGMFFVLVSGVGTPTGPHPEWSNGWFEKDVLERKL